MPKFYRISLIIRPAYETGPEQQYEIEVLARSEHHARRKIMQMMLSMHYLVSYFLQVERCK